MSAPPNQPKASCWAPGSGGRIGEGSGDTGLECQARSQQTRGRSRDVLGPSGCDQSCHEGMN